MKAILIKFLPATNSRPSRLKASASGVKSLTIPFDYVTDPELRLAQEFCKANDWDGELLVKGILPNGDTVFCFAH